MPLIFVYGTLKRGGSNHHLMAGQQFLGEARTPPGYRLYELGGHPGMIVKTDDRDGVTGEVWSVEAASLAQLDLLEGLVEGLYRRVPIKLLPPFADQPIETYLYAQSVEGRKDIGSTWGVRTSVPPEPARVTFVSSLSPKLVENFVYAAGAGLFLLPIARHAVTAVPLGMLISGPLFQGYRFLVKPLLPTRKVEAPSRRDTVLRAVLVVALVIINFWLIEWLHVFRTNKGVH